VIGVDHATAARDLAAVARDGVRRDHDLNLSHLRHPRNVIPSSPTYRRAPPRVMGRGPARMAATTDAPRRYGRGRGSRSGRPLAPGVPRRDRAVRGQGARRGRPRYVRRARGVALLARGPRRGERQEESSRADPRADMGATGLPMGRCSPHPSGGATDRSWASWCSTAAPSIPDRPTCGSRAPRSSSPRRSSGPIGRARRPTTSS
jgi:hypothetical protein